MLFRQTKEWRQAAEPAYSTRSDRGSVLLAETCDQEHRVKPIYQQIAQENNKFWYHIFVCYIIRRQHINE